MTCKGICNKYKSTEPKSKGLYSIGLKRCNTCDIFLAWTGLICPCCGYKLRTKPRNKKYKIRLREALAIGTS